MKNARFEFSLILFLVFWTCSAGCLSTDEGNTMIVAHRGYSCIAPENTLSALKLSQGVSDMAEFDVRVCSTGELILMHDSTLDRTTDGTGKTSETCLNELKKLDSGSWFSADFKREPIPSLQDAVALLLPETIPLIEHKTGEPDAYAAVLSDMEVADHVVVQSFNWEFLEGLRAEMPGIRLGALGGAKWTKEKTIPLELTPENVARFKAIDLWMIGWWWEAASEETISRAHKAGFKVFVWTVDDPRDAVRLVEMGVDGIITNCPERISEALKSCSASKKLAGE